MKLLSLVSKKAKKTRMSGRSFDKKIKSDNNANENNDKPKKKSKKELTTKQVDSTNPTLKESLFCYDNYGYGNYVCNEKDECIMSNNTNSSSCQCKCNCDGHDNSKLKC